LVASRFKEARGSFVSLVGGRLANEDLFNIRQLNQSLAGKARQNTFMAGGDLISQMGVSAGTNLAELGPGDAILVIASDLIEEAPVWWLRVKQAADRGASLMVMNPRPTKLDKFATHLLPVKYGREAAAVLAMIAALDSKKTRLPDWLAGYKPSRELAAAAKIFAEARHGIILFGQDGMTLANSQVLAQACANLLFLTDHLGKPHNGLLGAWPSANTQGAWEMGFTPSTSLAEELAGAQAIYVAAADPAGDDPVLAQAVSEAGFVVVQELFLTETARRADVVLPVTAQTERDGTFTSGERRVQRFFPAVPAIDGPRPDFAITAAIGGLMGLKIESRAASLIFSQIAAQVADFADLSYRALAETHAQWPIIGRSDLYYGGTTYENTQGLGAQLAPAAQRRKLFQVNWLEPEGAVVPADDRLWVVPITTLYDRGTTLTPSEVLQPRLAGPQAVLNEATAERFGVRDGSTVALELAGEFYEVLVKVRPGVPDGIALVPRSMGIPVKGPAPASVRLAVTQAA
jgi:NADH-quinone oxidoreductase subunit G